MKRPVEQVLDETMRDLERELLLSQRAWLQRHQYRSDVFEMSWGRRERLKPFAGRERFRSDKALPRNALILDTHLNSLTAVLSFFEDVLVMLWFSFRILWSRILFGR